MIFFLNLVLGDILFSKTSPNFFLDLLSVVNPFHNQIFVFINSVCINSKKNKKFESS